MSTLKCPSCEYENEFAFDLWVHLMHNHTKEEITRDFVYNVLVPELKKDETV